MFIREAKMSRRLRARAQKCLNHAPSRLSFCCRPRLQAYLSQRAGQFKQSCRVRGVVTGRGRVKLLSPLDFDWTNDDILSASFREDLAGAPLESQIVQPFLQMVSTSWQMYPSITKTLEP